MGRVGDDFAERWLLFLDSLAKKKDERTRESLLCGLGFSLVPGYFLASPGRHLCRWSLARLVFRN